jgi:hypothetical protein
MDLFSSQQDTNRSCELEKIIEDKRVKKMIFSDNKRQWIAEGKTWTKITKLARKTRNNMKGIEEVM